MTFNFRLDFLDFLGLTFNSKLDVRKSRPRSTALKETRQLRLCVDCNAKNNITGPWVVPTCWVFKSFPGKSSVSAGGQNHLLVVRNLNPGQQVDLKFLIGILRALPVEAQCLPGVKMIPLQ